jgi:hypothetical protein
MDFLVNRADLHDTKVVDPEPLPLAPGQARLRVERFALSANNITYAALGDVMQYWNFFPAEQGWGRVPVWGFAEVVESLDERLAVGRRVYGYLPMSEELVVEVGAVDDGGFSDVAGHRAPMPGVYSRYVDAASPEDRDPDAEDQRMLLFPLFFTSFLVDDFLADNGDFGASVVVISSASSKTALGIAHRIRARGGVTLVGLTSPANVALTGDLGLYDLVVPYGAEHDLPDGAAVYIDVSGSPGVRAAVHGRYGEELVHDMILGATHWNQLGGDPGALEGAPPTFFFAPDRIALRQQQWGRSTLEAKLDAAWDDFAPWAATWIDFRHDAGVEALRDTYLALLDNRADPKVGHILTLQPEP